MSYNLDEYLKRVKARDGIVDAVMLAAFFIPIAAIIYYSRSGGEVFWMLVVVGPFIAVFAFILGVMVRVALKPAGPDGRKVYGIPLWATVILLIVLGPLSLLLFGILYLMNRPRADGET